MQKETMGVPKEGGSSGFRTVSLPQAVQKHPAPLVAISLDFTRNLGSLDGTVKQEHDRSCTGLGSETLKVTSKAEDEGCGSPGPLCDKTNTVSSSSGTSLPTACRSCGFPWKALLASSDSTPTPRCEVHANLLTTAFADVSNMIEANGPTDMQPPCQPPPAQSQHEQTRGDDRALSLNHPLQHSLVGHEKTVETPQREQPEATSVNPSDLNTPCSLQPSSSNGIREQNQPQSVGLTKPSHSGKIQQLAMSNSVREEPEEKPCDKITKKEKFAEGTTTSPLSLQLSGSYTSDYGSLCRTSDTTSEAGMSEERICRGKLMKRFFETIANPEFLGSSSSEDSREAKLPVNSQLVMALRVETDPSEKAGTGKVAKELMDSKLERTRRWIEELPLKWVIRSYTKLTRKPSLKWIQSVKKGGRRAVRKSNFLVTSETSMRNRHNKTVVVRPEYDRRRWRSGSRRVRRSSSPVREQSVLRSKHRRSIRHSRDIVSEGNRKQTRKNRDDQSEEEDKPTKRLLPGFMGALEKAKNKFRNKRESISEHAKAEAECSKDKNNDSRENGKHSKTEKSLTHDRKKRSHGFKTSLVKHPITMPVSQVRIINHGHRRDARKRRRTRDDEEFVKENERFGERCNHPACEKLRSPATLWDMLERSRAQRSEQEDRKRHQHARSSRRQRGSSSSSEESVIYQKLDVVRDRLKQRYAPGREENVRYGRGYLLDTMPGNRTRYEDDTLRYDAHNKTHDRPYSRGIERWFGRDHDSHRHHNIHELKREGRVRRRALLRESSSSSDSSSEALVISKPNKIPRPYVKMEVIEPKPKKNRVTLSPHRPSYSAERTEPSRFHRASAKESHLRKHHAQLVREILKLNREHRYPTTTDQRSRHSEAKAKKKRDSSESADSSGSEEYSRRHQVKSAPAKSRREETYQAHTRPKSLRSPSAQKRARLVPRLSHRRLTSSDSADGTDSINVKDFVDFLVTLSRNTVGTLTNKRKAMRLYRSYLNGEYGYDPADEGDLASRIRRAHHRQK